MKAIFYRIGTLVVMAMMGTGCASYPWSAPQSSGAQITGVDWRLVELHGQPAVAGGARAPFIRLEGQRLVGHTGCNSLSGSYDLDVQQERLRFPPPVATTRMACADARMNEQERAFTEVLAATDRVSVDSRRLVLYRDGRPLAEFEMATP